MFAYENNHRKSGYPPSNPSSRKRTVLIGVIAAAAFLRTVGKGLNPGRLIQAQTAWGALCGVEPISLYFS